MGDTVHICYSLNDINGKYTKYVGTSICSLLENTKQHVDIHILHDETLTNENRKRLSEVTNSYGQNIYFYNVLSNPIVAGYISDILGIYPAQYQGMFYRLGVGIILPHHIERLIYLDADIIVNMDIEQLWNIPLGAANIAAVPDDVIIRQLGGNLNPLIRKGFVKQDAYFNSGVLLMDMIFFRNNPQIMENIVAFLEENDECKRYPDQDYLNYIFRNSCLLLPNKFNLLVSYARLMDLSNDKAICHYAGNAYGFNLTDVFDKMFWHYFCKTPWQNEIAFTQMLSNLLRDCREMVEVTDLLKLLLARPKHIIFGSRELASKLDSSIDGIFYDSNEDVSTNLECGDIIDAFQAIPEGEGLIILVSRYYSVLKNWLIGMGLREGIEFVNGYPLTLPEKNVANYYENVVIKQY